MKFGMVPVDEAENAILAHGLRLESATLKKGQIVTAARRRALSEAGVEKIVVARLDPGDVGEDEAARRVAERLAGAHLRREPPFAGRVNLFAQAAGLVVVDAKAINRVNGVDEAITVATLAPFRAVAAGDMAATVKIIPFAAPGEALAAACDALPAGGAVSIAPFRPLRFAVASTLLPGLKTSVVAKTLRALEARLAEKRFLCGDRITEADWRLFTTLVRFDPVYVGLFKCNLRRIADYPHLTRYLGELRAWPGIAETIDLFHIKRHYYESLLFINPTGIVPLGPAEPK